MRCARLALALAVLAGATPIAAEPLDDAFRAAFGKDGSATIVSTATDLREQVKYVPGQLLTTSFGPVLVSIGEVVNPSHASSGKIAVDYLKQTPRGYAVGRRFVPALESGSFGRIADWGVSRAFGQYPMVAVEGGGTIQGYTCSVLTLLELAPSGPREVATIPMAYDNSGAVGDDQATSIDGIVANIRAGGGFDIVYSGAQSFTDHYDRQGDRYVLAGGGESRMETC